MSDQNIAPHSHLEEYNSFATEIDLIAEGGINRPARAIYIKTAGAGVLRLKFANGKGRTLTVQSGDEIIAFVKAIESETDVGLLWVGW